MWILSIQFKYTRLDVVQLRFLRLHSNSALQEVTIECSGAHNRKTNQRATFQRVLHLLGDSSTEISGAHTKVSRKGCEVTIVLELLVLYKSAIGMYVCEMFFFLSIHAKLI